MQTLQRRLIGHRRGTHRTLKQEPLGLLFVGHAWFCMDMHHSSVETRPTQDCFGQLPLAATRKREYVPSKNFQYVERERERDCNHRLIDANPSVHLRTKEQVNTQDLAMHIFCTFCFGNGCDGWEALYYWKSFCPPQKDGSSLFARDL